LFTYAFIIAKNEINSEIDDHKFEISKMRQESKQKVIDLLKKSAQKAEKN
jgi:hypothetical protein